MKTLRNIGGASLRNTAVPMHSITKFIATLIINYVPYAFSTVLEFLSGYNVGSALTLLHLGTLSRLHVVIV